MKRNNVKQITIRLTADEYAHVKQLSSIGTNINQIAKVANASGYVRKEDIQSIMEMQAALWRAVKRG